MDTTGGGGFLTGADVTFSGPVDATDLGGQGLTVLAGEGAVRGFDQVGAVTSLSSMDVSGGSISWSPPGRGCRCCERRARSGSNRWSAT